VDHLTPIYRAQIFYTFIGHQMEHKNQWAPSICDDEFFMCTLSHVCYLQRKSVSLRPLPNADFLSSDWFMWLCEGQLFCFENFE